MSDVAKKCDEALAAAVLAATNKETPLLEALRPFVAAALDSAVLLDSHWDQERRPEWFNWQEDALVRTYRSLAKHVGGEG